MGMEEGLGLAGEGTSKPLSLLPLLEGQRTGPEASVVLGFWEMQPWCSEAQDPMGFRLEQPLGQRTISRARHKPQV